MKFSCHASCLKFISSICSVLLGLLLHDSPVNIIIMYVSPAWLDITPKIDDTDFGFLLGTILNWHFFANLCHIYVVFPDKLGKLFC